MISKNIFIFVLSFLICSFGFSQSAFQFKYHFKNVDDTTTYNAFMVCYGNGTGFIRVKFHDAETNSTVLIDMEMEEHYAKNNDGTEDTTKFYFKGTQPRYIYGDSSIKYDPEVFWFKLDPQTDIFEPWGITVKYETGVAQGEFISAKLLEEQDINKDIVLEYFTKDDDLYKNFFTVKPRGLSSNEKADTKLNVIIVANTEDESIGKSCITDKDRALKTFGTLARVLDINMNTKIIADKDYSKANVEKAILDLKPAAGDIVVFYYSGHGFSRQLDEKHRFPYLDLRSDPPTQDWNEYNLNIEDIYNSIKKKGARFNLVLSDCCNNDPNAKNNIGVAIAHTRGSGFQWSIENCKALFMNKKPINILVTAATKGQLASGTNDDGGYFSYYFKEAIEANVGKFNTDANWEEILKGSANQTISKVKDACTKGAVCAQDPIYIIQ